MSVVSNQNAAKKERRGGVSGVVTVTTVARSCAWCYVNLLTAPLYNLWMSPQLLEGPLAPTTVLPLQTRHRLPPACFLLFVQPSYLPRHCFLAAPPPPPTPARHGLPTLPAIGQIFSSIRHQPPPPPPVLMSSIPGTSFSCLPPIWRQFRINSVRDLTLLIKRDMPLPFRVADGNAVFYGTALEVMATDEVAPLTHSTHSIGFLSPPPPFLRAELWPFARVVSEWNGCPSLRLQCLAALRLEEKTADLHTGLEIETRIKWSFRMASSLIYHE